MNVLSERLKIAVDYLRLSGYAKSRSEIANRIGIHPPALSMCLNGDRVPTWGMLLDLCDIYPINFWWLRSGEGDMIGACERELALRKKIEVLEQRIKVLEKAVRLNTNNLKAL